MLKQKSLTVILMCFSAWTVTARLMEKDWSYQEMFDKSDLVIVGIPVSTKDTNETIMIPGVEPPVSCVGVRSEIRVSLVLKGSKKVEKIVLHHYRLEHDEPMVNGPQLVKFNTQPPEAFLMFLQHERDSAYAPASGQTDPALYSIIKLQGFAK